MTSYTNMRVKALTRSKKTNKGRVNDPRTEDSKEEIDSLNNSCSDLETPAATYTGNYPYISF
jgi:hypothetical protein